MRTTCLAWGLAFAIAGGCSGQTSTGGAGETVDVSDADDVLDVLGGGSPDTSAEVSGTDADPVVRCDDPAADVSCDDGDLCTDDACDAETGACVHLPKDCDDGLFCNGAEVCDSEEGCQAAAPPAIDDGVPCTVDACDEDTASVTHIPDDEVCQDQIFCNGAEICDATLGCQGGAPPDASDGLDCTLDACDETTGDFTHLPLDSACDDGLVCNGLETCDISMGCQVGAAPDPDDGVPCTVDTCDDSEGGVLHTPDDGPCQDGFFCNGAEICDPILGCQESPGLETDDGVSCTLDACDETAGAVTHTPDDGQCVTGGLCVLEGCDPLLDCFSSPIANCCGNGLLESDESCDDGNTDDTDGCTTACKLPAVEQVRGGFRHTCVRFQGGTVKCWGWNAWGQLGPAGSGAIGDEPDELGPGLLAVDLGTVGDGEPDWPIDLHVGGNQTCAVLTGGAVKCWGNNVYGQLGLGDKTSVGSQADGMGDALPAVDLGTDEGGAKLLALDVSTAPKHSCALLNGGAVKCWGDNVYGQLGVGDTDTRGDEPGEMGDALPFVDLGTDQEGAPLVAIQVANSEWHSCAVLEGGGLKCWGKNQYGELGLGDSDDRGDGPDEMGDALPFVDLGTTDAGEPLGILGVSARNSSTCAILEGGSVKCWGYGGPSLGLGAGGGNRGDAPEELGDNLPYVDTGEGLQAVHLSPGPCALFTNGRMKCWGYNDHGQLGQGDTESRGGEDGEMGDALPFVDLGTDDAGELLGVSAITSGSKHTCAVLGNGRVKCWGQNDNNGGQLGLGDTNDRGDEPDEMGDDLPFVDLGQ